MTKLLLDTAKLAASIQHEWRKIALLGMIFLLFVSNAIGLIQFGKDLWPGIDFRVDFLRDRDGNFALPDIATNPEFIMLMTSGVLLIVFLPLLSPIRASLLVFILGLPPVWLAIATPYDYDSIPMQFHLLVLLILFGINVLVKYFSETHEKQELLDTFSQYLPPQVVKELSAHTNEIVLEGESRLVTVMFCDLRNFTAMSAAQMPLCAQSRRHRIRRADADPGGSVLRTRDHTDRRCTGGTRHPPRQRADIPDGAGVGFPA